MERNWAGNVTYSTERILRPRSTAEAQEMIAGAETLRPLGTRHSFSTVADSTGALLSTEHLDRIVEIGDETVTVEAGIRYGELATALHDRGLALPNFASLPHISVGGAIATATHGSGAANQSLAAGASALELVTADGSIRQLRRGDADFDGAVVGVGALGLVTRVSLDVVPAFDLRQYVFEQLPLPAVEAELDAILARGYSVSLFTTWEPAVAQAWVKTTEELDPQSSYFGGSPAPGPRNPVPGSGAENATEQLGVPGPSHERLPHFRLAFTPSSGAELQSEYVVPREHGAAAASELRRLGAMVSPLLFISEIRSIAEDTLWLSPFFEQDSVAFHFTWKPLPAAVLALLPRIESALEPFDARPHWGKLFVGSAELIEARYPKLPDFRRLAQELDGGGKFRNAFLDGYIFSRAASAS
ncbi:MAG: FAD-binding protein [Actinomycetia bacterium]|nr:FAD-binding protein [Actinomycetes bacterium]